jgi:hypothetical protein
MLTKAKVKQFLKDNKWAFLQMGLMMLPTVVGYANDASSVEIDALKTPLSVMQHTMTGTLPKVGVSVAAAGFLVNWGMGNEQQVAKGLGRLSMAGGAAMYVIPTINNVTGASVTGCLF